MSAYREIAGNLVAKPDARIGLVVARFNELATESLLHGAIDTLTRHGVKAENLVVVRVPGSFEIPLAARRLAESGKVQGIVCLGAVIRGATAHFDFVAGQTASGIAEVMRSFNLPVAFGIVTAETMEQALERSGLKAGNRGNDAALAVLEMLDVCAKIAAL